ncbi:MAG: branched-chain amino acid ABC transporter permease, partial [Ktedonobacteraceae bacterium]
MSEFYQHLVNAMLLGSTYALIGVGLTLIFGIMKLVNFTHGELYTFGAYMMYLLVMIFKVDFFIALVLAVGLGILLGAVIEFILVRPLRGADMDTTMIVLIGAWIIMQNTELLLWTGVGK